MAMLNFKYGLHKNLPAYDSSKVGSIFVTTDEHAMYVDLPEARIRISQIVSLATITDWQSLKPPYDTESFYYIVEANALLKCNGTKTNDAGEVIGEWVQINSTSQVEAELATLQSDVSGLKTSVTTINGQITALQNKNDSQDEAIADIVTEANALSARIDGIGTLLSYKGIVTDLTAAEGAANDVCVYNGAVYIHNGSEWVEYDDIVENIEGIRAKIETLEDNVPTNTAFAELSTRVTDLETWKSTTNTAIEKLQTDVKNAQDTADNAVSAAATADGKAVAAKEAADAAQSTANAAATSAATANATANANKEAIEDTDNGLAAAHTKAQQGIDDAAAASTAAENAQSTANDAKAAAATNATNISANATAITDEIARAKEAEEKNAQAITDLRTEVMEDIQTADAMVFKDVVSAASELPAVGETDAAGNVLAIGWTYKASKEFTLTQGEGDAATITQVHIGDLLIATGEEVDGALTNVIWKHIPSGYVADYNPEFEVVADETLANTVYLNLTSGVNKDSEDASDAGDLGQVILTAKEDSAVTVSAVGDQVVIGMQWSSFDTTTE